MGWRRARLRSPKCASWFWFIVLVGSSAGCSSYDPSLVGNGPAADQDSGAAGSGSAAVDSAVPDGATSDANSGTAGVGPTAGTGAVVDAGMEMDATVVDPMGKCYPNPNTEDEVCPEICPERCNNKDDDCDRRVDEGEAHDDCDAAHADAICQVGGTCLIARCLDGHRDCNEEAADGCEITPEDPNHCGSCTTVCEVENGTPTCNKGQCAQKSCNSGFTDCDSDPLTCETPTTTLADCGGCNVECKDVPNASPSCATGACGVLQCNSGFDDCDEEGDNGCEQRLNTTAHCGGCDQSCSFPGSNVACDADTQLCIATSCKEGMGYFDCDSDPLDGCESTKTSEHCGACGKVCSADALTNVMSANCGTGTCVIVCDDGFGDCDGDPFNGCETEVNTVQNCGSCDACPSQNMVAACNDGTCEKVQCVGNFGDCDGELDNGCERPLDTLADCGGCDDECGMASCSGGICTSIDCGEFPGYGDCDGDGNDCETNLNADLDNCGGCGTKCEWNVGVTPHATLACSAQGCKAQCDTGYGDCDGNYKNGCEAPLNTTTHCGMCGQGCGIANADATCASGTCEVSDCATDYADCNTDGLSCETAINTPTHCGACNATCNLPNAVEGCGGSAGARVCTVVGCEQAHFKNCDNVATNGCEIDTRADSANCGTCGTNCGTQPNVMVASCVDSGCAISQCNAGYGNCSALPGCETQLNTVQNCGGCNNNCDALPNVATTSCDSMTLSCKVGTCDPGFANCDGIDSNGCETNIYTVQNCGGCANLAQNQACDGLPNANTACASGTCTITSCASASYANCDGTVANGCERDVRSIGSGGLGPCLPDTGCVKRVSGTHEYYTCPGPKTWAAARDACRLQKNGDLARLNDATEKSFVHTGITANSWLGHNDLAIEGLWVWSLDNMPFWLGTSTGSAQLGQYTNWAANEPNASGDCGVMYLSGGTLDDTDCTFTRAFVCEVNPDDCTGDASKIQPGQCGCGNPDTDADADGFAICNDACDSDPAKRAVGLCGCGVTDTNTDGDAQPDCTDACDNDPAKVVVGICGCGVADTDSDGDTFANCIENCDSDPSKQDVGLCGCGVADTNTDGDTQADCNETCDSDPNKIAPGQCGCGNADTDTDSDGTANCNDMCPNNAPKIAPGVCGCAVADTNTDGDSQPDCVDGCPNNAPKTAPGVCGCAVADTNTDGDAQPDCTDECDNDATKVVVGICGCGIADTDSDGDTYANCIENCDNDPAKQNPGACGCGIADTNTDGDAQADCNETCDSDPAKLAPGQCGCGNPDTDNDSDGTANCNDGCPDNAPKTAAGVCGCAVADTDSDGDGTPNCNDGCPMDGAKTAPGACGCGVVDTNTDNDTQPDCTETCDSDPNKLAPGQCGCGVPDIDTDADGTANCNDTCPFDASNAAGCFKTTTSNVDPLQWSFATAPTWNCNAVGTTTINTTTGAASSTSCALGTVAITNNVAQTKPGLNYGKITGGWNTTTANPANLAFDPLGPSITELNTEDNAGTDERWVDGTTYVYSGEIYITSSGVASFMEHIDDFVYLKIDSTVVLDNGDWGTATAGKFTGTQGWHTFELRVYDGTGGQGPSAAAPTGRPAFGYSPTDTGNSTDFTQYIWPRNTNASTASLFRAAAGGPNVAVVRLSGLTVSNGHVLAITGDKPAVILVAGNVTISSTVHADASGATAGGGGNWSCGSSAGSNGTGDPSGDGGGGGGGGFGTNGGKGGDSQGGAAGVARGVATLVPLLGGCKGGNGGGYASTAGAGAGAIQISAGGTLTVSGTVRANGGVGANFAGNDGGGAGGGSGGAVLLEGYAVTATGATITASGGRGGDGDGGTNGGAGSTSSAAAGTAGTGTNATGSGGGGGGYGRRRVVATTTCTSCPSP
jgi:hypothetical protein